jgi:hypothetical protein
MGVDLSSFQCIEMTTFDTATLTGSYTAMNTGFSDDIKILKIVNMGTNGVEVSYDGVTDHDFYAPTPNGVAAIPLIINLQANHSCNSSYGSGTLNGRQGQIIYGKGTAGTGNLYIIGYR